MNCTQERLHWHTNTYGESVLDSRPKPCGEALNEHGLCPVHHWPLCAVCGLTMGDEGDRRYGTHKGCEQPVRPPEQPLSGEAGNAMLASMEREYMRCGGRQGYADERFMASDRGMTQEERRRARR